MPVSKHRKKHAQKALQRKTEIKQYRNTVNRMYREMYEKLRSQPANVAEMLNAEEQPKLPGGPDQTMTGYPVAEATYSEEIIDGKPRTVITLPDRDPNEPVSIVSQWPADMQLPEVTAEQITTSS